MKALRKYVAEFNKWCADHEAFNLSNLDEEMAQRLFLYIDNALSPENLTCDGMESAPEVKRKAKMLYAAGDDLIEAGYTPANKYSPLISDWRMA